MPHQKDRRPALLGVAHQQRSALAHLRNTTRRRLQLLGKNGLDRVHDHNLRLLVPGGGHDALDAGLGHDLQFVFRQAKPAGAHGDLLLRLFTGDIQRRHALGQTAQGLQ